ncbi:MAG: LPS assembly protein LptD [Holosporales bacterium]|nr:LPS assembly protein LptD [Holosporales bacterium]
MKKFYFKILFFLSIINVTKSEITLDSDKISYDSQSGIVTASGGVVIFQTLEDGGERELRSEKVIYNEKTGEIDLIGDPVMREPNGDIISAKAVKLDKDLKKSIIDTLRIVLKDATRIRAERGTSFGKIFTFKNASYSPCRESGCPFPLWDLVAEEVIYDKKKKKLIYKNAKLRIKGIPILFSPYFEHPSPEVKRQTGFLAPVIRNITGVGFLAAVPFYIAIKDDKDLKITPFFISKGRALVSSNYRQVFTHCDFEVSTSFLSRTKDKGKRLTNHDKKTRWHFDSILKSYKLDNKQMSFRINRASDVTYKSVYPADLRRDNVRYLAGKYNDSNIVFDFYDKNYFLTTESHLYQTADRGTAPFVFPHINFNYKKEALGGEFTFDNDSVYLTRKKEQSEMASKAFFRTSNKFSWNKQTNANPFLIEVNSGFRTDIFSVNEAKESGSNRNACFPILENQLALSIPFLSKIETLDQYSIWGPKLVLSSVESLKKKDNFEYNEDSIFDNFSDLNLWALNRFGGYDSIENGERISIGVENSIYNAKRRCFNAFIGKSHNIGERQKAKFQGQNSLVGRLVLKPIDNFSFRMRFVGMPIIEKSQLFETGIEANSKGAFGGVGYLYDKKINHVQENGISQIGINFGFNLNEFWKISASEIFNAKKKNGKKNLTRGVSATYSDECFDFALGVFRTNFKNDDIRPRTGIILSIGFKNIGNMVKANEKYSYDSSIGNVE